MDVFNHLNLMASCCVLFWMRRGSRSKQNSIQNFGCLARICNNFFIFDQHRQHFEQIFGEKEQELWKFLAVTQFVSTWKLREPHPAKIRCLSTTFKKHNLSVEGFQNTLNFNFSVKSWRGILATIRNNPSTKHGEPFRLILPAQTNPPGSHISQFRIRWQFTSHIGQIGKMINYCNITNAIQGN